MKANYTTAINFILQWEGGYVNNPKDPGGPTNHGITLKTAQAYWKHDATAEDLKAIPMAVVHDIYRKNYADKVGFDSLPSGLDLCVFDAAVLSGPAKAKQFLRDTETVGEYQGKRLAFYQSLRHWDTFGKGWTRRINDGTKEATKLTVPGATLNKDLAKSITPAIVIASQAPGLPTSAVPITTGPITYVIYAMIGAIVIALGIYVYNRYKKYKSIDNK